MQQFGFRANPVFHFVARRTATTFKNFKYPSSDYVHHVSALIHNLFTAAIDEFTIV